MARHDADTEPAGASDAVGGLGWRYLLGTLRTSVLVGSLGRAVEVAARAVEVCGDDADGHLRVDLRADRVVLTLQSLEQAALTARDVDLAQRLSAAVREAGLRTEPEIGTGAAGSAGASAASTRSVQILEIGIDALDIAAVRPFWKAVLGYADEAGADGPEDPIVDPVGQGPAVWFQQMDQPRPQRNRIHFDVSVPHDEAPGRIEAALAAGGRLLSAARAPAFWVLADIEGNEACVTTWQGRDGAQPTAD
ncbi:VOC family protein [Streptacidiphilus sp. PAMC 29251]